MLRLKIVLCVFMLVASLSLAFSQEILKKEKISVKKEVLINEDTTKYNSIENAIKSSSYINDIVLDEIDTSELCKQIDKISKIFFLSWKNNDIISLPDCFKFLNKIEYLKLNLPKLEAKHFSFNSFKNLEVIYLSNMSFIGLPFELNKCPKLSYINLYKCNFQNFRSFDKLKHVYTCNIISSFTDSIPPEILNLIQMSKLKLKSNRIKKLSPDIKKLKNLYYLALTDNCLTSLPEEICDLTKLSSLYLENNRLKKLPKNIFKLKNLLILSVEGNPLPLEEIERIKKQLPWCSITY